MTAAALFAAVIISAQPNSKLTPEQTVLLYADSFQNDTDPVCGKEISYAGFDMMVKNGLSDPETLSSKGTLKNVSDLARLDLYFPEKGNGQMVIVCPGGGYSYLSTYNEGLYVAEWMLEKGITVCVVKYRMPNGHHEIPLSDVENAFRYCRSHAAGWGINSIGVMGFSAGGHLAASVSNLWSEEATRPDFSILIYPVITMEVGLTHKGTHQNLIGKNGMWKDHLMDRYSIEKQVSRNTPATFLALSSDDTVVPPENSLRYYDELVEKGIPVELHIWPTGGHGWGFSSEKYIGKGKDRFAYARDEFYISLERWLKNLRKNTPQSGNRK